MGSKERTTLETNAALRLSPQTVFSNILEGHKTFGDMAPQYGMTVEQFEKLVLDKVGPKDFSRLKKASERYEASRNRIKKNKVRLPIAETTFAQHESSDIPTPEPEVTNNNRHQEENTMSEKIACLNAQRENAQREILSARVIAEANQVVLESQLKKVVKAEDKLAKAKKELAEAKNAKKEAEDTVRDSQINLEKWQECLQNIESQIAELESQVIYLVAPSYHGEMPKYGTLVSVMSMPGVMVEDTNGVELMHPLSAEDMFLFDSMQEAKQAYNYLRLVIKYALGEKEYRLLVDSEEIKTLLKKQELD